MNIADRIDAYEKLIRLDKPIGILLLLWPTLWALWFASRSEPDLRTAWIFVLGTVLMRSAGCAFNDFADRDFDGEALGHDVLAWLPAVRGGGARSIGARSFADAASRGAQLAERLMAAEQL